MLPGTDVHRGFGTTEYKSHHCSGREGSPGLGHLAQQDGSRVDAWWWGASLSRLPSAPARRQPFRAGSSPIPDWVRAVPSPTADTAWEPPHSPTSRHLPGCLWSLSSPTSGPGDAAPSRGWRFRLPGARVRRTVPVPAVLAAPRVLPLGPGPLPGCTGQTE